MTMGIRQVLFAGALALPLIGGIVMLEGSLGSAGITRRPEVPIWFALPFLWSIVLAGYADRFFDNMSGDRPSAARFSVTKVMFGMVLVYATTWIAEMISFTFRYLGSNGGLGDLIWWPPRTGRHSYLPGGVGPTYLYTLACSVWAAIQGYDRMKHHEGLNR